MELVNHTLRVLNEPVADWKKFALPGDLSSKLREPLPPKPLWLVGDDVDVWGKLQGVGSIWQVHCLDIGWQDAFVITVSPDSGPVGYLFTRVSPIFVWRGEEHRPWGNHPVIECESAFEAAANTMFTLWRGEMEDNG